MTTVLKSFCLTQIVLTGNSTENPARLHFLSELGKEEETRGLGTSFHASMYPRQTHSVQIYRRVFDCSS